jgi:hypothetical protein
VTFAWTLFVMASVFLSACSASPAQHGADTSVPASAASSHSTSSLAGSGSRSAAVPQIESNPPGDIPDNQAFVAYRGPQFEVSVPEGWARTTRGGRVEFADKYNDIAITSTRTPSAPTVASVRSHDVTSIRTNSPGFVPGPITTVHRGAGAAVLMRYQALSPVNPVTGKVATEAVERYLFWRAGTEVALTLSAPVGSDNVDPWRKITDSFAWTA